MKTYYLLVALTFLLTVVSADIFISEASGTFGYDDNEPSIAGPSNWGSLPLAAICKTGTRQSPVDIPFPSPVSRSNGPITLAYKPSLVNIANRGNSFSINSRSRYLEHSVLFIQNLVYAPLGYRLFDLHMHWGRNNSEGSEHSLGGRYFPLEAHFVHYNSRFPSIDAAVRSGDHDALTVIGVFFQVGPTTPPSISKILSKAPYFTAVSQETEIDEPVDLSDIYPKRLEYFTYLGSFTTPRCNEVVRWIVLARPVSIRQEDLDVIRNVNLVLSLTKTGPGRNFRPTQAIGTRKVTSSFSSLPVIPSDPVRPTPTPTPTPTPIPEDPENSQPLEG